MLFTLIYPLQQITHQDFPQQTCYFQLYQQGPWDNSSLAAYKQHFCPNSYTFIYNSAEQAVHTQQRLRVSVTTTAHTLTPKSRHSLCNRSQFPFQCEGPY